jgi:glycosyltransferase involved in cell wall biosynthesis
MKEIFDYKDNITPIKSIPSINIYGVDKERGTARQFTICIPTYKRVDALSEAILSAINQVEYDDYNVIVVDNNPDRNDETELFMLKYKEHSKITYYKNSQNVGMAGNWNKCLILASSDNVVLLHDDDVLSPYSLIAFNSALNNINRNWAMVKPNLRKFSDSKELTFSRPSNARLIELKSYDFFDGDGIGAPTCILMNKKKIIENGGYDSRYYPSMDYKMTSNLILNSKLYIYYSRTEVGGYRIGLNQSLSEKTMDEYFEMRYKIGGDLMRLYGIPQFCIKLFQSIRKTPQVHHITKAYKFSEYKFKLDKNFFHLGDSISGLLYHTIDLIYSGLHRIHSKTITNI